MGDIRVSGNAYASAHLPLSDANYKTNIDTIEDPLEIISNLNGIYYEWDTLNYPWMNFSSGRKIGFVGQQVDTVLPEVVEISDSGRVSVNYASITALLVEGMKKQQNTIESLQSQIDSIIGNCCEQPSVNKTTEGNEGGEINDPIPVKLETMAVLYQNIPNPFGDNTTINYFLPKSVMQADMVFYDSFGRPIKTVEITNRGNNSIQVDAADLANGIYTYSLIADGQVLDTKKMVCAK